MQIIQFLQIDSTNSKGLELAASGAEHGTVIWAFKQTGGRGQYDRSFFSPAGGLYLSIILKPKLIFEQLPLITLATGIACVNCIQQEYGIDLLLKWPNDLYLGGKKLGGILTETLPLKLGNPPVVVVGIGINVKNSMKVPEILAGQLAFLEDLHPLKINLKQLLGQIVKALIEHVNLLVKNSRKLLAAWNKHDYLFNRDVRWHVPDGSMLAGVGRGIEHNGQYRLLDDTGRIHLISAGSLLLREKNKNPEPKTLRQ